MGRVGLVKKKQKNPKKKTQHQKKKKKGKFLPPHPVNVVGSVEEMLFLARSTVGLLGIGRMCTQLSRNGGAQLIPRLCQRLLPHSRGQSTWNSLGRTQIPSPEPSQHGIKAPTSPSSPCWDSLDSESPKKPGVTMSTLELMDGCCLWTRNRGQFGRTGLGGSS